jgi:predicted PhzF superfamily epimerase YddE/YHI9
MRAWASERAADSSGSLSEAVAIRSPGSAATRAAAIAAVLSAPSSTPLRLRLDTGGRIALAAVATLHLLRVFCAGDGSGGNPLAVFLDGAEIPSQTRQQVAADLGLSETVFVDDPARGELRIFTPTVELDFAGHPTVGTAWLLARERGPVEALHPPAGAVPVRYEDGQSFVAGRPEWPPHYHFEQLSSPEEVTALDGPPPGHNLVGAWAWVDEEAGILRSRVFPVAIGVDEDEATGAAAVQLCGQLGRPIDIRQGRGSRILARPREDGAVEIGGRSLLDEVREYAVRAP